jgi:hypothetical protein
VHEFDGFNLGAIYISARPTRLREVANLFVAKMVSMQTRAIDD